MYVYSSALLAIECFFFSVRTHGFQGNVAEERDVVRWWQDDVTEFGKLTMLLIG